MELVDKLVILRDGEYINNANYETFASALNKAMKEYDISTCIRKIHFLAQCYHETQRFTLTYEENPRNISGGNFHRGRGFIQLTHKGNEDKRTGNATSYLGYKKYSGHDVISDPDLISNSLDLSAESGGWYWKYGVRKIDGYLIDLNTKCSDTEASVKELTRLIKGSTSGYKDRYSYFVELLKIFNCENLKKYN